MKDIYKKRIGEILVDEKLISNEDVIKILNKQKETDHLFGEIAIDLGLITEPQMIECLVHQCGIPYIDLLHYDVDKKLFDLFPEHLLKKCIAIPIEKIGRYFVIAVTQLLDEENRKHFQEVTKEHVFFILAKLSVVRNILNVYYNNKDLKDKELTELGKILLDNEEKK